jgi:cytochrome c-type biogenesis protein CcsB
MKDVIAVLAVIFYGLSSIYFFIRFFLKKKTEHLPFLFLLPALLSHAVLLILFGIREHRLPVGNLVEACLMVTWVTVVLFTLIARGTTLDFMGIVLLPFAVISIFLSELNRKNVAASKPMMGLVWAYIHVPLMILSVATLALTFVLAVMYLLQERQLKSKQPAFFYYRLPSLEVCEDLAFKSLWTGFFLLTLGIVTGMIASRTLTGVYWNWDYKEIWALITWIVYAILIHGRLLASWRGRKAAYLAIVGFAFMLFAFAGVSFLVKGYHAF